MEVVNELTIDFSSRYVNYAHTQKQSTKFYGIHHNDRLNEINLFAIDEAR